MANDTLRQLEERVARLEEELRQVKAEITKAKQPEEPWWKKIAGSMKGDKTYAAIVREIRKNRRADYQAVCAEIDKATTGKHGRKKRRTNHTES